MLYSRKIELTKAYLGDADEDEVGVAVAAVKMCPAKDVVTPDSVARVIAGPPTEITWTTGTPFAAMQVSVPLV